MPSHENKPCARCGTAFECKVGTIHECQCSSVVLTAEETEYAKENHEDCLCAKCLNEVKHEYQQIKFEKRLKSLGEMFN